MLETKIVKNVQEHVRQRILTKEEISFKDILMHSKSRTLMKDTHYLYQLENSMGVTNGAHLSTKLIFFRIFGEDGYGNIPDLTHENKDRFKTIPLQVIWKRYAMLLSKKLLSDHVVIY